MAKKKKGEKARFEWGKWLDRHEKKALFFIVLIALGLRLWHLFLEEANDPFFSLLSVDPKVYHDWAIAITQGDFLGDEVFFLSPLYPYFLAAIYAVAGPSFFAARLVQTLIGTLSCLLVYFIGKQIFNIKVGFLAGLVSALAVTSIFYDSILLVVTLHTFLNLVTMLLLVRCFHAPKRSLRWFGAGACLGLSALARPNVLLFAGFVLAGIYFVLRKQLDTKKMCVVGLVFSCGIGVVVFPVTLRNWVVGHDFVLVSSQGGVNFFIGNGPDAKGTFTVPKLFSTTHADHPDQQREIYKDYAEKEIGRELRPSEISSFWFSKTLDHIAENPGQWMGLLGRKFMLFINKYELGSSRDLYLTRDFSQVLRLPLPEIGLIAPLGLLGMVLAIRRLKQAFLVYAMVATYIASFLLFFVIAHYRMPVVPFIIIFSAYALCWFFSALQKRRFLHFFLAGLALAGAIYLSSLELISFERTRFMVHFNLANKYRSMEKFDMAIKSYKRSIAINPNYISAHNNLAVTYEASKDKDKAIAIWSRVLKIAMRRGDRLYIERAKRRLHYLGGRTRRRAPPETRYRTRYTR